MASHWTLSAAAQQLNTIRQELKRFIYPTTKEEGDKSRRMLTVTLTDFSHISVPDKNLHMTLEKEFYAIR